MSYILMYFIPMLLGLFATRHLYHTRDWDNRILTPEDASLCRAFGFQPSIENTRTVLTRVLFVGSCLPILNICLVIILLVFFGVSVLDPGED